MREIKFRAFDKQEQSMSDAFTLLRRDGMFKSSKTSPVTYRAIRHDDVIMQFTGLMDKNGKEIYESDILRVDDNYDKFGFAAGCVGSVIFDKGRFMLAERNGNGKWYFDDNEIDHVEIIGDIHRNPELLK